MALPAWFIIKKLGWAQGDLAFMFILSANEKQWAQSSGKLKQLVELFRA